MSIEPGKYRVRIGDLVIDEDDEMYLEIEIRDRPYGTLMASLGKRPLTPGEELDRSVEYTVVDYIWIKFGADGEKFIDSRRGDEWYMDYYVVDDDGYVHPDKPKIINEVESWLGTSRD